MMEAITAGLAPGIALLCYFYLKDRLNMEPLHMVIRSFLFGVLIVFPIMFLQYIFQAENVMMGPFQYNFIAAGLLEESLKWLVLIFAVYHHPHFDERYDGIVYSTAVSLGFASFENIFYLFANGIQYAIGRALLPVTSHALFGVIMGYYLGKAKFTEQGHKKTYLFIALAVPVFLHGTYDYILSVFLNWTVVILPFMAVLWWYSMQKVNKVLREQAAQ